jgi:hypothetical protein
MSLIRSRWAAIGAALAVSLSAGGIGLVNAGVDSGERPVTVTVEPRRVLDTRKDLGLTGVFGNATPRDLQITGSVTVADGTGTAVETVVPTGAVGVLVNVTVVAPSHAGFLTLRPGGAAGAPSTSTVNFTPGVVAPNAATVDLSGSGKIQVWTTFADPAGVAHVLVDVVGYTIDHTHDDRYYTAAEVDSIVAAAVGDPLTTTKVYAGLAVTWTNPFAAVRSLINNCLTLDGYGGSFALMYLPIDVPVGSSLESVNAVVLNDFPDSPWEVALVRMSENDPGFTEAEIGKREDQIDGFVNVIARMIRKGPVTVNAGDAFYLRMKVPEPTSAALCSVEVTYTRPPPAP